MSVIVKDMEMPNTCKACVCSNYYERMDMILCDIMDKQLDEKQWKSERHHDCPLIEVHTPHGRLIDKAKLKRELFVNFMGERIPFYDCDNFPTTLTYIDLHSILSEQPTVIEAED